MFQSPIQNLSGSDAEPFRVAWKPQSSLRMQSESSRCEEEETPSLLWGLDPVFLAFAKLYVRDILDLKESRQVPGIFFYNGHPVKQVDVLGTVVGVRERDAFYSYGVDDSTGVINCICWKKLSNTESSSAQTATAASNPARDLSLTSQLKKLQETIQQRTKIEIGDLIRIRGYVRTYREEREIHATAYYKVDDPVWSFQISRMLELPVIYRKVYDQPFHSPALEKEKALKWILRMIQLPRQFIVYLRTLYSCFRKRDSFSRKKVVLIIYTIRGEGLPLPAHLGLCSPEPQPGPERSCAAAGARAPGGPE
ncbi:CST complex subunit STN1 isoform X8 [Loxodonta africana]|uniref:CST complex subunit STN1 isoform X8 n=1 Tax=Loxodonta africana TaxID=9785 RepID=UPI0030CEA61A